MPTKTMRYSGWGRALWAESAVARPERMAGLERQMAEAPAPAFGMLRSYGDVCLNDGGRAINMARLDRMMAFDAETGQITVEAGVRIGDLARALAPRGWLPAVMPGTGFATVGGAIANDVHGKNHHIAGSFGQHVRKISLITPKGAKTATPKKGKELFEATVGGMGQTGVIATAELQLIPTKGDVVMVTERRIADWDEHLERLNASDAPYSVGWIDATATGAALGRGILEEGETGSGLVPPQKRVKKVPFDAPGFALAPPVVRAFNAAYWRRVPAHGRTLVKRIRDFFFPLDKILEWNRLYGKAGFHQFQCVVPLGGADALKSMLEMIARAGAASPLAVLKRMGPGRGGLMSFPMEGYTLAVDFHASTATERLVKRLEDATLEAGGRIYLAKDSLAGAGAAQAMYPDHKKWAQICAKHDPDGALQTDLMRRLNLRGAP
ncbi:MAG: FAD-binding oxidoreductase [Pseudomonadota bacterium]